MKREAIVVKYLVEATCRSFNHRAFMNLGGGGVLNVLEYGCLHAEKYTT